MKNSFKFCWLFALLFFVSACENGSKDNFQTQQSSEISDSSSKKIPSAPTVYEQITLSDYRGQWVFINYWAAWCTPCKKEIPELNAFYAKHRQNKLMVLGVNYDRPSQALLAKEARQLDITYPVIVQDPLPDHAVEVLPLTVIVNSQGKIVARLWGEQTQQSLEQQLAQLRIESQA